VALMIVAYVVLPGITTADPQKLHWSILTSLGVYNYSTLLGGPLGEEPGWRGYALPRLQTGLGPVRSSLVLGLLWTGWHLPLFLYPGWTSSPLWIYVLFFTGQSVILDPVSGDAIGFSVSTSADACAQGFALEAWTGAPGAACGTAGAVTLGYILLPFVQGGVFGDFTIENGAISFSVTGAVTKDGAAWGAGPYGVEDGAPLSTAVGPTETDIARFSDPGLSLAQVLRGFYEGFLQPLREGDFASLCMKLHLREMLEPTGLGDRALIAGIQPVHDKLVEVLARHLGLPLPDLELKRLAVSLAALGVHVHSGRTITEEIAPGLYSGPQAIDDWSARLVGYALAMVQAEALRGGLPFTGT
jgi:hypothetical protein